MSFGCQSEVAPIRRLVLRHPRAAFGDAATIGQQWRRLNFLAPPDPQAAAAEFDRFASLFEAAGVEVHFLEDGAAELDSIYVHDPVLVTARGAILCNMGKAARRAEPAAFRPLLERLGIPVLGAINGAGRLEGGDLVWLDARTVAVGEGDRSNAEGIRQLRDLLRDEIDELITVPLPAWRGPGEVLHLMSLLSPVDQDLAVVYSPLLPAPFRERLLSRGMRLIEVPEAEFESMGCNVLALAPRDCVLLTGNPRTRALLEAEGCRVTEYAGREISLKGAGGPTCLTRPIWRD
ncbi:MAG: arginine deiminase family protein [Alphaproteobacteria bacterium]|nr:arginine deiminase family protein [Alphaproteobacteria bacterium]